MPGTITDNGVRRTPRNEKRSFQGVPLVIEYRKGETKPSGRAIEDDWGFLQHADYGYVVGTTTNEEGEGLDVFVGPDPESERVFLFALMEPEDPDSFMEYKAMLGFSDHQEAIEFCELQYPIDMVGGVQEMTIGDLLEWAEIQQPMTEKLLVRLNNEEMADEVKIEERARDPVLVIQ